jgi:hypothetical protein
MRIQHPLMATRLATRPDTVTAASEAGGTAGQKRVWPRAIRWPGEALNDIVDGADVTAHSVFTNSPDTRCGFRADRDCN